MFNKFPLSCYTIKLVPHCLWKYLKDHTVKVFLAIRYFQKSVVLRIYKSISYICVWAISLPMICVKFNHYFDWGINQILTYLITLFASFYSFSRILFILFRFKKFSMQDAPYGRMQSRMCKFHYDFYSLRKN